MTWHSLYLPFPEHDVTAALRPALNTLSGEWYDPFGLIPSKAYRQTVRLFIAPQTEGWTRVLAAPDSQRLPDSALASLSEHGLCLSVTLEKEPTLAAARVEVYEHGTRAADAVLALKPHLLPGRSEEDLRNALTRPFTPATRRESAAAVPLEALPENVQQMAKQVNPRQFDKLFGKLMKQVNRRAQGSEQSARSLLAGTGPDWDSPGGQRIRAVMGCLMSSDEWRTPDFITLRDAYQLHLRRQRSPNAMLYPGDAEAMAQVPNALAYTPLYLGLTG